jgi:hypothetical protein
MCLLGADTSIPWEVRAVLPAREKRDTSAG